MKTTVAGIQMRAEPGVRDANVAKAERFVLEAIDRDARLVLLPELFNVGYYVGPSLFEWWEDCDGPTVTWMRETASRRGAIVAGTIAERRDKRLFNSLFVAQPGGSLARYSKRQPTKFESAAFDAGDDDAIVSTPVGRIGCVVCADMNYARSLLAPMAGSAEIVLFPQASSSPKWLARLLWRWEEKRNSPTFGGLASALGVPILSAGLVGPMQQMTRFVDAYLFGGTWIADANGHGLAHVARDTEGVAVAEIDLTPGTRHGNLLELRDPGLGRALMDALVIELPNMRPRP
jgi:N-carbamoylputrescine amidase